MLRSVAIKATNARGFVANTEIYAGGLSGYRFFMLSDWLRDALDAKEMSQVEMARLLTERLGRSIDRAAVNKMSKGTRAIAGDELIEIQKITGVAAPTEIMVPLKGKVGAGQAVYAIDDGDDNEVPAPAEAKPGTVAVRVSGDSMFPAYEEGELLYYSKLLPPDAMVNKRAVVQLGDGRIFVKVLRKGTTERTWTLQSVNTLYADMIDEVVEWAAPIDWTKPRY
ncbi:S24 family peptidase [Mesorhizobium sp. M7D.F.Ca.US.005.01.1.1]|uniref:S24 family peptidase n=1 Tax=Mesorhizobium sp. M7D.F.Ca.US.005.01.1.1 TaxID=2493678 RepID=UPI001FE21C20|nr:S24 family peptidase [Mesorhizobium sp. M7D.F.Ca.US.005.01.1.1]